MNQARDNGLIIDLDSESDEAARESDYSSDPDWVWLAENGYVSDTSTQYSELRPKKLLKKQEALPWGCNPAHAPADSETSSDAEPPQLAVTTNSSPEVSSFDPFWGIAQNQCPEAFQLEPPKKARRTRKKKFRASKHTITPPRRPASPSGWGTPPEEPMDEWPSFPACKCTGWCNCPEP